VFRVQPEQVSLPNNGGTITRNRLTLMTPTGMTQAILEDVQELRFTDPQTRAQIERLLAGLTENRAKDRRVLSLGFRGAGKRDVALSYVVAAPVWKTSRRPLQDLRDNLAWRPAWCGLCRPPAQHRLLRKQPMPRPPRRPPPNCFIASRRKSPSRPVTP